MSLCWLRFLKSLLLVLGPLIPIFSFAQPGTYVDLVLHSGTVVTVDENNTVAEAVAVKDDTIMVVGATDSVLKFAGPNTETINLKGATAIPGFIDSHAHFLSLGRSLMRLNLTQADTWEEIIAMVDAKVAESPPGTWILGRGWHQEKWSVTPQLNVDGLPVHDALSAVSPNHPVMLTHASGHAVFANATAMELAGVTADTPDPVGGEIVRDKDGNPIGVFRETAEALIADAYDKASADRTEAEIDRAFSRAVQAATDECLSKGITTFYDAGSSFDNIDRFRRLADNNELRLRLWVMVSGDQDNLDARLSDYKIIGYGNHHLTVRAVKMYADGALGSHGAWMLQPYDDMPSSKGLNVTPLDTLRHVADIAARHGFQLCTHAIGDRANREVLDIYESSLNKHPDYADHRWRIEHAQHIDTADISRFGQLGVIPAMQGVHCTSDGPWVPKRIGMERARCCAYPWRSLLETGAVISNGTDAPVEDVSPIACFHASVTRRLQDGTQFFPEQAMTREEALRSYTIDAAYAGFEENFKGSLRPGKLADITVLSRDILTCPDDEIPDTKVLYTIVGGEIVYSK